MLAFRFSCSSFVLTPAQSNRILFDGLQNSGPQIWTLLFKALMEPAYPPGTGSDTSQALISTLLQTACHAYSQFALGVSKGHAHPGACRAPPAAQG